MLHIPTPLESQLIISSKLAETISIYSVKSQLTEELVRLVCFYYALIWITKDGKLFYWRLLISWWPVCGLPVCVCFVLVCVVCDCLFLYKAFCKAPVKSRAQLCHPLSSPLVNLHQWGLNSPRWKGTPANEMLKLGRGISEGDDVLFDESPPPRPKLSALAEAKR